MSASKINPSAENLLNQYREFQCHCTDRSFVHMVIKQTKSGKYELFTVSEVHGMGRADYNEKVICEEFDDIVPFNSVDGISHVALLKNKKWSIIEITDDDTAKGKWRWLEGLSFDRLEEVKSAIEKRGSFNTEKWLQLFSKGAPNRDAIRELRKDIYGETCGIVKNARYKFEGEEVILSNENVTERTVFYDAPQRLVAAEMSYQTQFVVVNDDCLVVTKSLIENGYNPCVLNMASRQNPGGGVRNGSGAQEENLFRRSNLYVSLYQYAEYAESYGVEKSVHQYPLNRNTGGVYSPGITVFRGKETEGYDLLAEPYKVSVVSVAAMNGPATIVVNGELKLANHLIEPTKEKIRTILRIAGLNGHDSLVLSAFGCGAYCNPPKHVAELFKAVFEEPEFKNRFRQVAFAIIDDHNAGKEHNQEGNYLPFKRVFAEITE